jgi:putative ubiquitin-RnfH superfamily antitoxin RatB of RatAB toxin-antitoxin module
MGAADPFTVEVIHALPDRAVIGTYRLAPPASIADALALAAADPKFAGIDVAGSAVGIFGRQVPKARLLQPGDRIELYRALAADPKEARRTRAKSATGPRRPR